MKIKKNKLVNPSRQPILRPFAKGLYQLWDDYRLNDLNVTINRLFIFDGASIPRLFWTLLGSPYLPRYILPALVHDFFMRDGRLGRKGADQQLYRFLRLNNVNPFISKLFYFTVRAFGWWKWWKYRLFQKKGGDPVYGYFRSN